MKIELHGYDFTVISDYRRYYPSLESIDAYREVPHEMNIVIGEEVHLHHNDVHIVNFGSKYSVNGLLENSALYLKSDRRSVIDNIDYPIVGNMRFVKYVRFLLDDFTPLHDDLCYEKAAR